MTANDPGLTGETKRSFGVRLIGGLLLYWSFFVWAVLRPLLSESPPLHRVIDLAHVVMAVVTGFLADQSFVGAQALYHFRWTAAAGHGDRRFRGHAGEGLPGRGVRFLVRGFLWIIVLCRGTLFEKRFASMTSPPLCWAGRRRRSRRTASAAQRHRMKIDSRQENTCL
jgi:hypothetical protein